MSVGDLLDEWFEYDVLKGASPRPASSASGPARARPAPPTTCSTTRSARSTGAGGAWGHVRGGMGAISMAIARSAEAAGATIRTGAAVALDRRPRAAASPA